MKKTTLYNIHLSLNAKMTTFGGYQMPVQYSGVKNEHLAVRKDLGVFDVSHMGEFYVHGPNSLNLLQHICSNDISKINIGKAQYNYLPNETGGIVDDLIVYRLEEEHYLLVVNASNIKKDWNWIQKYNQEFKAQLEDHSKTTGLLAIQGPKAIKTMQKLTNYPLDTLPFYSHTKGDFADIKNTLIATTGYTGAGGIEIYFPAIHAEHLWKSILKAGASDGIIPAGLAARDTLRIEMGYCLYGNEIHESTSPIAAGLNWVTKPETGFVNSKNIDKQIANGSNQQLIGFIMDVRAIPRSGYSIIDNEGNPIGLVTSGTQSPTLSVGIGLGYVEKSYSKVGTKIGVLIREKNCFAHVVKLPFIKA